jgi:aromatic-L-amino-acid decarboxylase
VLVRVGDDDAVTAATLAAVQADGTCWPSGTTWRGRSCIRLSVCNWQTTSIDVERSVDALARAAADARSRAPGLAV